MENIIDGINKMIIKDAQIILKQRNFIQITRDSQGRFKKVSQIDIYCKNHPKRKAHSQFMCRSCYDRDLKKRNTKYAIKIKKYQKKYGIKNKIKLQDYAKKYRKTYDKNKLRNSQLKHTYGITLREYNIILKQQNNRCIICGKLNKKTLHVDHNHKTKKIRGLLCFRCNYGLGYFHDSIKIFKNIVTYLGG